MSILHRVSVIAICASFIYAANGQATCALSYENGTELSDTYWSFGFVLDTIDDTSESGTVLLNMTASSITSISTIVADSDSGYFYMQPVLEDGQFIVTLTDYFSQYEELESTTTMLVTITFVCSVNTRSLEIYQPITDTNNNYPEFQDAPYTYELPMPFPSGFSVQLFGTISAKDIDLTNTNISFTLNSSDPNANGFSASWLSQDTSDTKLHYAQLLTTALLNIEEDVTFKIYATDTGTPALTSETNIIISVDEENSTPSSPIFTYPIYISDLSGLTFEEANGTTVVFNQGDITLSQGASNTTSFTIVDNIGSYEDNFLITVSEDYTTISITLQNVNDEFLAEYYVILTLTAARTGATDTGITILHIALPGIVSTECSSTTTGESTTIITSTVGSTATISAVTSETESTIATTTITECPTITTDECVCDSSTTVTSAYESTYTMTTDGSENSTTTSTGDGITDTTESVTTAATTVETTECPVVTVTQECDCTESTVTTSYSATTNTEAVDSLTTTLSPESETTTLSTEDGTTVTTTTTVTPGLSFSSITYRFDKDSTFTGVLMTQTAVATNAEGTIVYSVSINDDDLSSRVIIDADTAALEVTAAISPGVYTFQILATIDDLSLSTSATVILVISTLTECSGDIVFGYALQIIELEEESAHENILPLDDNGCNYTIYSQTPSQDLFTITGNYLNTVAIDREASYFSNMTVAQVRVIIDASCPNDTDATNNTTTTRSKRDTEYEVLTENIAYERTRTILVVIITDINDNAPVWNSNTPTYIGFPGYELAQLILVPYVYQLGATDADIDDNAMVTYTLGSGSDDVFYIHNTDGTLYIQQGVYTEDGYQFTVTATDGTFETSTDLTVRTLASSNVAVLFINGGLLEDVDDIVEELSTSTGYWVQALTSAVISESDAANFTSLKSLSSWTKRATDTNTLLRLVLYGLNITEPVASETLVSTVESTNFTWGISDLATLESILADSSESGMLAKFDTRGYWAAIIVLSVLLLLLAITAGVVYFLFCRPKKSTSVESDVSYENFENRQSNQSNGSYYVKSVTLSESQDHVSESTDSTNAEWVLNQTTKPDKLFFENNYSFSTLKGSNDGDITFVTRNESRPDTSPNLTKRKSVAFSSTVEEIEVARL